MGRRYLVDAATALSKAPQQAAFPKWLVEEHTTETCQARPLHKQNPMTHSGAILEAFSPIQWISVFWGGLSFLI